MLIKEGCPAKYRLTENGCSLAKSLLLADAGEQFSEDCDHMFQAARETLPPSGKTDVMLRENHAGLSRGLERSNYCMLEDRLYPRDVCERLAGSEDGAKICLRSDQSQVNDGPPVDQPKVTSSLEVNRFLPIML